MPRRGATPFQMMPIADVTHERVFGMMGRRLRFETNDPQLMAAAEQSLGRFEVPAEGEPLVVRLFSESRPGLPRAAGEDAAAGPRDWEPIDGPAEREMVHRTHGDYFVTLHQSDAAIVDLAGGIAVGWVSASTAADRPFLRYAFIESMALSLTNAPANGCINFHAAGVARAGRGVVLTGPAGAGKSTIAYASARRGLTVFAEDGVFVREGASGIELWGLPWVQRLLPDARELFPELAALEPRRQPNGELKLEVDLDELHPGTARPCAAGGPIVMLERGHGAPHLRRIEPDAAVLGLVWSWDAPPPLATVERLLAEHGAYSLLTGSTPDQTVDALEALFDELDAGRDGA